MANAEDAESTSPESTLTDSDRPTEWRRDNLTYLVILLLLLGGCASPESISAVIELVVGSI